MSKSSADSMHANHLYLLHWARNVDAASPGARILDYGCGVGEVVVEGRREGLDIVGADVFYEGASSKREVDAKGLLGTVITEMKNGKLEYANETFDLILSNQVVEHTADLDAALAEISRAMKPAAKLLCIFPTREVVREGHIGIPFVHWFEKGSPRRLRYTLICRAIGFGYFKKDKPIRQWADEALEWMDKYTHYRTADEALSALHRHFTVTMLDSDYADFRLGLALKSEYAKRLSPMLLSPLLSSVLRAVMRRLMGVILLAEKR